jgi:YYY domain-containing protein
MFNQAFLIFLLAFAYKRWESLEPKGKWLVCIFSAISLGSMPLINTWDVLIYAPVTLFFGALILWRNRADLSRAPSWMYLISVPPIAVLCYLPFYLQLQTQTGAVSIVRTPSEPFQFLLVNGFFIVVFIAVLSKDIAKRPYFLLTAVPFAITGYFAAAVAVIPITYFFVRKEKELDNLLAVLGLLILIVCEIFYMKDNMGETYFRMNTVFKCYLPAWFLLGTAACLMAGRWLSGCGKVPELLPRYRAAITVLVVCCLFALPFLVQYNMNFNGGTLDGLAYLDRSHPGDAGAVAYLRSLPGNEVLIEAEGGDYSYYSRVSSFTGIPAVVGMPFHEFMWRGDDTGWFGTRLSDIRIAYEEPDRTTAIMKKYNATLLFVGDAEREKYRVGVPAAGLEKIYAACGTEIYRLST